MDVETVYCCESHRNYLTGMFDDDDTSIHAPYIAIKIPTIMNGAAFDAVEALLHSLAEHPNFCDNIHLITFREFSNYGSRHPSNDETAWIYSYSENDLTTHFKGEEDDPVYKYDPSVYAKEKEKNLRILEGFVDAIVAIKDPH